MSNDIKYPASKVMLDVIIKEYEFESNRKNSIETRAGIILTLEGALLTIMPSFVSISSYTKLKITTIKDLFLPIISILIFVVTFILLCISINFLVKSLSAQNYKRLSTNGFNIDNASADENEVSASIVCEYANCLNHNMEVNKKKVEHFNSAIRYLQYALILYATMFLINNFK